MIIDVHAHFGYSFFPIEVMYEDALIAMMDEYSIDISIASGFRGIFYGH